MIKKLLSIVFLGLLLSGNAYAEIKVIDIFKYEVEVDWQKKPYKKYEIHTLCIDGYKFITTNDTKYERAGAGNTKSVAYSTSVNTIQFMIAANGKMIPAKCN
tara:strand:+ start:224 stop:529 length:306 start_codon:yes stop_codon:yes gene_type:complete